MKRVIQLGFVIIFFFTATIPLIGWISHMDSPTFASQQTIAQPKLMQDNQVNWNFPGQFDDYWSKSFPFNSWLVSRYNFLALHGLQSSVNDRVIVGQQGWLYFADTTDDILKTPSLSDSDLKRLVRVIELQQQFVERQGSRYHFVVAPNKATIYPEYLPVTMTPITEKTNLERLRQLAPSLQTIDLGLVLNEEKLRQAEPIYHAWDSHWNGIGAYRAYQALVTAFGFELGSEVVEFTKAKDWQGDLTTMIYPDRQSLDWQYTLTDYQRQFIEVRPIRTWEDLKIETRSKGIAQTLLMYRDSFANALIPYLSNSFGQATYLRSSRNDLRVVMDLQPDQVVYEIVERNLDWILKETPIMPAPTAELPEAKVKDQALSVRLEEAYGYDYLNARWTDGADIERVIVVSADQVVEAFPIYQTTVDNPEMENGFSLYHADLAKDLMIYYYQQGQWYQMNLKIA